MLVASSYLQALHKECRARNHTLDKSLSMAINLFRVFSATRRAITDFIDEAVSSTVNQQWVKSVSGMYDLQIQQQSWISSWRYI